MKMNFASEIEEAANGPILGCVIGPENGIIREYGDRESRDIDPAKCCRVLPWSEARSVLDYEWDNGFGGADCHRVYAWTADRIVYVSEYDGATTVAWIPRNPTDIEPRFS